MRKLLFPLGLISLFLLLFFSCRRTEVIAETPKNLQHERFFTVSPSASPQAKAIAAAIKKQDAKYHFVSEVIKKAGYPFWDKVRIVNYKNQTTTGRSASDSVEEVVYVPFVLDSQKRTNAVLSVAIAPADSIYRMLYAANYRKLGYDTTDNTKWNARSAFGLFTSFDYTVFGHKKFLIKDSLLFKTPKDSIRFVATIVQHNGQDVSGRTANQWDCLWMDMCPVKSSSGDEEQWARTMNDCFRLTLCFPLGTGGSSGLSGAWIGTSNGTGPVANPTGDPNIGGGGWWYGDNTSPCKPTGGQSTRVDNVPGDVCGPGWIVVNQSDPVDQNGYYQDRINFLKQKLQEDPKALIPCTQSNIIPCDYLSQFHNLYTFQVPQSVTDRIDNLESTYGDWWWNNPGGPPPADQQFYVQDINDASGTVLNFDYFPIRITRLPKVNGVQWTTYDLLEYFRLHINDFIDNNIATFEPYNYQFVNDVALWNSNNPLTSVLHLNMVQDGSVIVSDYNCSPIQTNNHYRATTLRTPLDGYHPVSGHRSWGIQTNSDGSHTFYTTAVDRMTTNLFEIGSDFSEIFTGDNGFDEADNLWKSMQYKMATFIQNNGGLAEYYDNGTGPGNSGQIISRPPWWLVEMFLRKQISYDQLRAALGC